MTSLFRSIMTNKNQSHAVKQAIISQLSLSIKEIQLAYAEGDSTLVSSGVTDGLCTVLEALLIHGMKETFFNKMSFALSSDLDSLPQPNCWPCLLVYSHREVIDQINKLSQVKTDIGRCRAWLRIALNDTLTSSYLATMKKDSKTLRHYYKNSAFVRDGECLSIAITLIEGIESCHFELAYNSSLLNAWTDAPITLAGLWTPATKVTPVGVATDVVETIVEEKFDDSVSSMLSISSFQTNTSVPPGNIDEDAALRLILSTPTNHSPFGSVQESESDEKSENTDPNSESKDHLEYLSNTSNAEVVSNPKNDETPSEPSSNQDTIADMQGDYLPIEDEDKSNPVVSFYDMFYKHPGKKRYSFGVYNPEEMIPRLQSQIRIPIEELNEAEDFEVVPEPEKSPADEHSGCIEYLFKIPLEQGLDSQNYTCKSCTQPVGIHFERAIYCKYFGCYYCPDCHNEDSAVIPARVVFNWDFQYYPVCKKAANFLMDAQLHPFFNLKTLNPKLVSAVPDLDRAQKLRLQLYYLAGFLITCRGSVSDELQKYIWPREYLYEHMNIYSIADLSQIANGKLIPFLQEIVTFATNHVMDCSFCKLKGFICEICKVPEVIYPFQLESTHQCPRCNGVYHTKCFNESTSCPKCIRKRKYEAAKAAAESS